MSEFDEWQKRHEEHLAYMNDLAKQNHKTDLLGMWLWVPGLFLMVVSAGLLLIMLVMWAFFDHTLGANPEGVVFLGFIGLLTGLGLIGMGAEF